MSVHFAAAGGVSQARLTFASLEYQQRHPCQAIDRASIVVLRGDNPTTPCPVSSVSTRSLLHKCHAAIHCGIATAKFSVTWWV